MGWCSWERGKLLFTGKEVSPSPKPSPSSRKAVYFCRLFAFVWGDGLAGVLFSALFLYRRTGELKSGVLWAASLCLG